ncbi:hypothetical protein DV736_g405, partial [Chaetothyriales sp. CBS 134916]
MYRPTISLAQLRTQIERRVTDKRIFTTHRHDQAIANTSPLRAFPQRETKLKKLEKKTESLGDGSYRKN